MAVRGLPVFARLPGHFRLPAGVTQFGSTSLAFGIRFRNLHRPPAANVREQMPDATAARTGKEPGFPLRESISMAEEIVRVGTPQPFILSHLAPWFANRIGHLTFSTTLSR